MNYEFRVNSLICFSYSIKKNRNKGKEECMVIPIILALGKLRQNYHKFEARLGWLPNLGPV